MKKRLHRLLSMLMIVMMLVSMFPANAETGTATSEGTSPLRSGSNYVEKENVGSTIGSLSTYIHTIRETSDDGNTSANLEIEYQIPASDLLDKDGKLIQTWEFTREDVQLGSWGDDMNKSGFVTSGGKAIGTYKIEGDKFIITYYNKPDDYFLYTSSKSSNGIIGDLKCWGNWNLAGDEGEDVVTREFGDDTYTIYPHGIGDLSGAKSVSQNYDHKTGTVEWKIEATSTQGVLDGSNIIIEDTLPDGFTLDQIEVQYQDGTRQVMSTDNYTVSGKVITITLPALQYANGATQKHTVWITTKVNSDVSSSNEDQKNTAKFTYTKYDNTTHTFSHEASAKMMGAMVDKSVAARYYASSGHRGYLCWTITVNPNKLNIADMYIEDDMLRSGTLVDLSITPSQGAAHDSTNKRINFSAIGNTGVNTNTYTIKYYTYPTELDDSSDLYSYDKNTVYLKYEGTPIDQDDAEHSREKSKVSSIVKNQVGSPTVSGDKRVFTYEIIINPNFANIGTITDLNDYLEWKNSSGQYVQVTGLPPGFTFDANSVKYWRNDTDGTLSATSLGGLMAALKDRINADTSNGRNYNKYKIQYSIYVDKHATGSIKNFAQIVSTKWNETDGPGEQGFTGVPYDYVSKSAGGVEYSNNRIKWKVTINPEFQTLSDDFTVTDWLDNNSQPSDLLDAPKQKVVVTPANGGAAVTHEYTYGNLDALFNQVSTLAREGSRNSKLEVTYYTSIEKLGTVKNWIKLNYGEENAQSVEQTVSFNFSVDKNDNSNAGVVKESDGTYKLTWTGKITLPYKWEMPQQRMTISDTFAAEQELTAGDKATLEAALANALSMDAGDVKSKINYNHNNGKGFSLTIDHVPSAPAGATGSSNVAPVYFTYSTHISEADFARVGVTRNWLNQTINGVTKSDYEDSAYPAKLQIEKNFDSGLEIATDMADAEKLGWEISFTAPAAISGKEFHLEDTLPDGFQATRVQVKRNDTAIYDVTSTTGSFGGGNSGEGLTITSDSTYVKAKFSDNHKCDTGDVITMYISGKVKDIDGYFTGDVVTKVMTNKVKAYVKIDNELTLEDTDEASITVKKPEKVLVVDKTGKKLTDEINTVEYSVKINTEGKKFLAADNAILDAVDTLTWSGNSSANKNSFVLDTNSVKLYEYNNGQRGDLWTNWSWDVVDRDNARVITMKIPDGKAFELVYRYKVVTDNGSLNNLTITNRFQLNGEEYGGGDSSTVKESFIKDAIATARTDAITFFKFEKNNAGIVLPDAEFTLEKYEDGWEAIGTFETNADGKLEVNGVEYVENVLYRVTETKAPFGYVLDSKPFHFSFGEPASKPSGISYSNLTMGIQYYLYNEPETTSISITKNWNDLQNKWGLRPSQITVTAYPTNSNNPLFVKSVTVDASNSDTWTATISGLRKYDYNDALLTYAVREESVNGYTSAVNGYTINNTLEKVNIPVRKVWDDNHNQDNLRSRKIELTLYRKAEGESVATESGKVELPTNNAATSTADVWEYTFTDLPKYNAAGKEYVYSISEGTVPADYEVTYTKDGAVLVATNKHTPETVEVDVTKNWVDGNSADRPTDAEITLYATVNGTKTAVAENQAGEDITNPVSVGTDDGWSYTFTNLPKYKAGAEIAYSIEETNVPDGYECILSGNAADGFVVTNKQLVDIAVEKIWDDDNDRDGIRPTGNNGITLELYRKAGENGTAELVDTVELKANTVLQPDVNTWAYTWEDLSASDGNSVTYIYWVEEDGHLEGYKQLENDGELLKITNCHEPQKITVNGTKTWVDDEDEGTRPESITIQLYKTVNNVKSAVGDPITVTPDQAGHWNYSFVDLPAHEDHGKVITYSVEEMDVDNKYTAASNGMNITNTIVQEFVEVEGTKTWDDKDNTVEHPEITINLKRDGKQYLSTTVAADDTYKFEKLPKYAIPALETAGDKLEGDLLNGHIFVYTVEEETPIGYTSEEIKDNNNKVIGFKNTLKTIEIEGEKTWIYYGDNEQTVFPDLTIELYANGELFKTQVLKDGDTTYKFENLPEYDVNGEKITYTVEEVEPAGYIGVEVKDADGNLIGFKNTLKTVNVSGKKTWDGNENTITKVPAIKVELLRDGVVIDTAILEDGTTTYAFNNLPQYAVPCDALKDLPADKLTGKEFTYTVREVIVVENAKDAFEASSEKNSTLGLDFTNKILTTSISGVKNWNDNGNTVTHPEVVIELYRDKEEEPIATRTLKHGEKDYIFTDLPLYAVAKTADANGYIGYTGAIDGHKFEYSVEEVVPHGYTSVQTNTGFANTLEVVGVQVAKTWIDKGNENQRPETITINLLRDGKEYKEVVIAINETDGTYEHVFDNLPKYAIAGLADAKEDDVLDGHEFKYTVTEDVVADYTTAIDGYNVTNTITQKFTELEGKKTWIDGNDEAGKRPESIIIRLYRDGKEIASATVTEETGWAWKFEKLAVYGVDVEDKGNYTYEDADGHTFVYTVSEDEVEDYTTIQKGNDFTNTIAQDYTDVIGDKTWIDFENEDGKRPASITVNLLRDGVEIDEVTVGEEEGWAWEFKDLPMYAVEPIDGKTVVYPYDARDGHTFKYTVTEDAVAEYTTEIEGFDVINTLVQNYVEVSGTKTWVDPTGTVHDPITINLLRDGVEVEEIVLTNGVVNYTFENLPKYAVPCDELAEEGKHPYDGVMDGHIFTYTVTEDLVPGYTTVQNGTNFTNTIEQDYIPVTITKIWMDNGAVDVEHPAITVRLLRNGTEVASATLADGVTSHTFTNMLRYNLRTGQPYVYTVIEDPVEGYDTAINGLTITNTSQGPEMITVSGTKTWSGDNGREHDNASEVKITLTRRVAGGKVEVVDAPIVWDGATYSFNNLLKEDENGRTYIYSVREDEVEGYDAYYQGYDIYNRKRYDVVTVNVAGTKHWNDNDDAAGIRPEQVVVQLLRDGRVVDTATVSAAENWSYSFNDLPDNDGYGHYYTYTVAEQLVPGYWLRVEGNDLYNTREEFERMTFGRFREEELEELLDIFDYGVPLWGGLLGTGDEIPVYPFAFGGLGLIALVAFLLYNRKRNRT